MISTLLFTMSALCVAAMFSPDRSARPVMPIYTYYVCGDEPMPTWQRKDAPRERVAAH